MKFSLLEMFFTMVTLVNGLVSAGGEWCSVTKAVPKTRIHKTRTYSYIQYYTDYESVSICCDGYTKVSDTKCEPQCKPGCPTNTRCIRPNICECTNGYVGYSTHPALVTCRPACSTACPANAYCSQPNTCDCNEGYKKNDNGASCEPVCEHECIENAKCVKPNACACNMGYAYDNTTGLCEPKCTVSCPLNSICSEPNKCTCLTGYAMVDNQCQARCETTCLENAACTKPNQCECLEGYEMGKTEDNSLECIAKCKDECPENAFCSQPNNCECIAGYEKSANNTCEPLCQPNCPNNSVCRAPDTCSCLKGYRMLDNHCQPICDKACPEYSVCAKPNKCECLAGYQLKLSSTYNIYCEPQCQKNCSTFGKCVQPNKCECLPGYEMDEIENCRPICSKGCSNGLCYLPGVCICKPGYLMGPHSNCEPACSMPCENGSCVEPEICQCSEGYKLKNGSVNVCEPQCEPECLNGVCVAPNVCICNDNFEPMAGEDGYNHSNCQRIRTTTTTLEFTTKPEISSTTVSPTRSFNTEETNESTAAAMSDNTSLTPTASTRVSWQICSDMCQCWQEYDELGPLSSRPQCINACVDAYDKPCLNLNLCHCQNAQMQLICQSEDDAEEDPLIYACKIPRVQVTTSKTIELKGGASPPDSSSLWIILVSLIGACGLAVLGVLMYRKYCKYEDPILEYEL